MRLLGEEGGNGMETETAQEQTAQEQTAQRRVHAEGIAVLLVVALLFAARKAAGLPDGAGRRGCLSESVSHSQHRRLGAILDLEFGENRTDVVADRSLRQEQLLGDCRIAHPIAEEAQHIKLAFA